MNECFRQQILVSDRMLLDRIEHRFGISLLPDTRRDTGVSREFDGTVSPPSEYVKRAPKIAAREGSISPPFRSCFATLPRSDAYPSGISPEMPRRVTITIANGQFRGSASRWPVGVFLSFDASSVPSHTNCLFFLRRNDLTIEIASKTRRETARPSSG
jgi:hypothetical protein